MLTTLSKQNVAGTSSITYQIRFKNVCDLKHEAWDVSSYNESEHASLGTGRNFTLTCGYATCSDFNGLGETSCVNAGVPIMVQLGVLEHIRRLV